MPVVYRDDDSSAWGTMAIVLVVALFALLIGYFAWWQPRVNAETPDRGGDVTIVQPSNPQPSPSPSIIPVPVPGPQGPAGPQGAPGAPGAPAGDTDINITPPATDSGATDSGTTGTDTGTTTGE
ncbi:MAG: hypothetical protein ACK47B_04455 [Armatimonadota bacterium]